MNRLETDERVLDLIYGCVSTPEGWEEVGEVLCSMTGAVAAEMTVFRAKTFEISQLNLPFLSDSQITEYLTDLLPTNPRIALAKSQGCLGAAYADHLAFDTDELGRTDLLEWTRSVGLEWCAGTNLLLNGGDSFAIMLHWAKGGGEIDSEGLALLQRLSSHFRRAINLSLEVSSLRSSNGKAVRRQDSSLLGIAYLDASGMVLEANDLAIALLGSIGVEIAEGKLLNVRRGKKLKEFFRQATRHLEQPADRFCSLALESIDPPRLLRLLSQPIERRRGTDPFTRRHFACKLLVFSPNSTGSPLSIEQLGRSLGLSSRESKVSAGICGGRTPREIAESLKLSEETVRVYVRRVYQKLGVNRQAQLVRLMYEIYLSI